MLNNIWRSDYNQRIEVDDQSKPWILNGSRKQFLNEFKVLMIVDVQDQHRAFSFYKQYLGVISGSDDLLWRKIRHTQRSECLSVDAKG
jgi:hypothetical protein